MPTNEIHKGGKTYCGTDTNVQTSHWKNTNEPISCGKNGCK